MYEKRHTERDRRIDRFPHVSVEPRAEKSKHVEWHSPSPFPHSAPRRNRENRAAAACD